MTIDKLDQFCLAGGNAIALRKEHRMSDVLDFFTTEEFDTELIKLTLSDRFAQDISWQFEKGFSLSVIIKRVKVDFLRHNYKVIGTEQIDKLRMLSDADIAAMKLNAVAKRGSKKDFFDIYEFLREYPLNQMLRFFSVKYAQSDISYILRSLTYFEDAELEGPLKMIKPYGWETVKANITYEVRKFI